METEPTEDERRRAFELAMQTMVVGLWRSFLVTQPESAKLADMLAEDMLRGLETMLDSVAGRDAEITRHLAVHRVEAMWRDVRAQYASPRPPKPDAPDQGQRED